MENMSVKEMARAAEDHIVEARKLLQGIIDEAEPKTPDAIQAIGLVGELATILGTSHDVAGPYLREIAGE